MEGRSKMKGFCKKLKVHSWYVYWASILNRTVSLRDLNDGIDEYLCLTELKEFMSWLTKFEN